MQSMVLSRERISSVYALVIPVSPLFATASSFQLRTGIHPDSVIGTALRRACGASCIRLDRRRREKVIWEMITEHSSIAATRLRTWNVIADLRKVEIDEVVLDVSWEREGGTRRLVRLAMSLIRA